MPALSVSLSSCISHYFTFFRLLFFIFIFLFFGLAPERTKPLFEGTRVCSFFFSFFFFSGSLTSVYKAATTAMLLTAANRMRRAGVVIGTRVSHHRPHRALASSASSTVEGGGEEALNHSCVLASRPGVGNNVELSNFSYRADPLPEALSEPSVLSPGQVVLKTKFLSVDPYMRCMFDEHHPQLGDYQRPFAVDEPLHGGGVGEVSHPMRCNSE